METPTKSKLPALENVGSAYREILENFTTE